MSRKSWDNCTVKETLLKGIEGQSSRRDSKGYRETCTEVVLNGREKKKKSLDKK